MAVVHSWRSGGQSVGGSGMGLEESMTGGGLRSLGGVAPKPCASGSASKGCN
jgi:hypothetical protein